MQTNTLTARTQRITSTRVGRGGKRGKTSGRGTKGQKARAGHKMWPQIRETLKKLPKRRGYSAPTIHQKSTVLNLKVLQKFFSSGDTVNPAVLFERKVLRASRKTPIKILGEGELTKKLIFSGVSVSKSAREKIEKAGGTIQ